MPEALIGTNGFVATILDSTALDCISCEEGCFPAAQYNHQNQEINKHCYITTIESTTPSFGSCPKDALYSKSIQSMITHCI